MARDFDEINPDLMDQEPENSFLRWMSALILLVAVGGFFTLAWYAYHTGTETMDESEVELVKADGTPIKEMPESPGGQQFPHQDKTIYQAMKGSGEQPKVEQILPAAEEPLVRDEKQETETWINENLQKNDEVKTVPPAAEAPKDAAAAPVVPVMTSDAGEPAEPAKFEPAPLEVAQVAEATETKAPFTPPASKPEPVQGEMVKDDKKPASAAELKPMAADKAPEPAKIDAAKVEPVKQAKPVAVAEPVKPPVKAEKKPEPVVAKPAAPANGSSRIQLGAYKSKLEADENWLAITRKHKDLLGDKIHNVVRVDLGAKGVFYRLQASGFSSASNAKGICGALSNRGQGCFMVQPK